MNIFELLVKIKTSKNNLSMKAVYINNITGKWQWEYCIYYYDELNHSFYINGLDSAKSIERIEEIINKSYKEELNSNIDIFRKIYMNKKPKIFYIFKSKDDDYISIVKIQLKTIRLSPMEVKEFKIIY